MITRRNIRIKVMQTLYATSMLKPTDIDSLSKKILQQHFNQTKLLLGYFFNFFIQVSKFAITDAQLRSAKHLRSYEDLHVNTKIAENEIIEKLVQNLEWKQYLKSENPEVDDNDIKTIYTKLVQSNEYKKYISVKEKNYLDDKNILLYILSDMLLGNEEFNEIIEDKFSSWQDDGEIIISFITNAINNPNHLKFDPIIDKEKQNFALNLMSTVINKNNYLQEILTPKLKNWEADRIAALDLIIIKMGIAEFLYFETIPPKVTINEYIDLAKEYSTPQSGHFINGLLDNVHKEFLNEGKLNKIEFKKH